MAPDLDQQLKGKADPASRVPVIVQFKHPGVDSAALARMHGG